jgi:hypothetical protein
MILLNFYDGRDSVLMLDICFSNIGPLEYKFEFKSYNRDRWPIARHNRLYNTLYYIIFKRREHKYPSKFLYVFTFLAGTLAS